MVPVPESTDSSFSYKFAQEKKAALIVYIALELTPYVTLDHRFNEVNTAKEEDRRIKGSSCQDMGRCVQVDWADFCLRRLKAPFCSMRLTEIKNLLFIVPTRGTPKKITAAQRIFMDDIRSS
jgi:hypothetical protein